MVRKALVFLVILYQKVISPLFPRRCRFYPSCSQFCIQAMQSYGVVLGLYCTARRLLKCNPFNPGGVEYVQAYEDDKGFMFLKSLHGKCADYVVGGGTCFRSRG